MKLSEMKNLSQERFFTTFRMTKHNTMKQGKLIVFSAPSGSGKTTIVRHLLGIKELNLEFSISAATRAPRGEEVSGKITTSCLSKTLKTHQSRRFCRMGRSISR